MAKEKSMTKERARKMLPTWLTLASWSNRHTEADDNCTEAFKVLGEEEYGVIWDRWYREQTDRVPPYCSR